MPLNYRNSFSGVGGVFLANLCVVTMAVASINDVSSSLEQLGNPVQAAYPNAGLSCAQDLQLFQGKIFLGYGNLDNRTPKSVIYFDPISHSFGTDYPGTLLNDEILHRFRVFGNEMYVESFDPIALSNLYLRRTNGWTIASMNFPGSGRHNFDIYKFSGALFTGGGNGFPGIAMSFDGTNWALPGANITNSVFNNSEFFEFKSQLYVSQDLALAALFPGLNAPFVLKFTSATNAPFATLYQGPTNFYPSGDLNQGRISHFENFRGQGVFLGNGAVYVVSSVEPPVLSKVTLPNAVGDSAIDLLEQSNGVYYLSCVPQPADAEFPYLGIIGKSEDLANWLEICRFSAHELVQSFESFNGDFYVGLGNYLTTTNAHSGDLILIPKLAANEARSIVIPAALEFTNGRAGNTFPFGLQQPVRCQQVYSATAFASVSGPQLITHIAFRPSSQQGQAFTNTVGNLRVDLTTTSASPSTGLSTQFAANLGSDVSTVFTGAVVLASSFSGPAGGPKAFDVDIAFQKPFVYDPAAGNLLVDIYNYSGSSCTPLDITWGTGLPSSRMVSSVGGVNSATGVSDLTATCLITRFEMFPAALTNRAPLVFAGPPQTVSLPNTALLNGTALDDGLPNPPATLTSLWSTVSAPGTVTFGNPQSLTTTAAFIQSGSYLLRLTVGDGALSASSDVSIKVLPLPPVNLPPLVDAGRAQTISWSNAFTASLNSANLNGLVVDDGYPQPPGATTSLWSQVSGPGLVVFDVPSAPLTTARFSVPGNYLLRLTASDGLLLASNDVEISAVQQPGVNQAPSVNAGVDFLATPLESVPLNGEASDDGLPIPPAALTVQWTSVAGPGAVLFANASNLSTRATFPLPGKYVLKLTASDGALSTFANTTVQVLNGIFDIVPSSLSGANGKAGNSYPFNTTDSVRYQQVYASSQFPSNSGPFLVKELAFRPSATSGGPFTNTMSDLVVELSTTPAGPSLLSSTFAENVGPDKQQVFSGPLTISSQFTGLGPKDFDIILPLQRTFFYDPAKGNLLLDVRSFSGNQSTYFDGTWGNDLPSSRLVSRLGGVNDAQGSLDSMPTALATRFTLCRFTPPVMRIINQTNALSVFCDGVFGQKLVMEDSADLSHWNTFHTNLSLLQPIQVDSVSFPTAHQYYRSRIVP